MMVQSCFTMAPGYAVERGDEAPGGSSRRKLEQGGPNREAHALRPEVATTRTIASIDAALARRPPFPAGGFGEERHRSPQMAPHCTRFPAEGEDVSAVTLPRWPPR